MQFELIPKQMRIYRQWICWRYEWREGSTKPKKVPYSPASGKLASVTNPQSWGSYDEAVEACERHGYNGIGFVFTNSDPFAGIDLDDTQGDAEAYQRQVRIHQAFASYCERSPSGNGIHIIVMGSVPHGRRRDFVEVYSSERYFTMTGDVYGEPCEIADCNDLLATLWEQLASNTQANPDASASYGTATESDDAIYQRAIAATNGPKFLRLWNGEALDLSGDTSGSAIDMALVDMLQFYTNDPAQIERLWLASPHGQRAKTQNTPGYRQRTIERAFDRELPAIDLSEGLANIVADIKAKSLAAPGPRYTLLSGDDLEALAVTEWRIKGVLPARGIVAIYGPSGSGKSFTAIDMAFAIVEGRDWPNGRFRVTKAFVIYLALEGQAGFRNRVTAWRQDHGHMPTDIRFVFDAFRLHDPAFVAELVEACKPFGPDIVIFIDTMNRATAGMNENSPDDMGKIVEGAAALQRETGGLVVIVAHPGKDAEKQLRGHSSLYAALDTVILVERQGERRSWKLEKSRDGEDGIEQRFTLETLAIGIDADGDTITSCVVRPDNTPREKPLTPNQNLGMTAWTNAANESGRLNEIGEFVGVHIEDWRKAFYAISTADNPEAKKKAFSTLREGLVSARKLTVKNDVYSIAGPTSAATNEVIAAAIKARGIGG